MIFEAKGRKKDIALRVQEPDPTHVGRNIVTLDRRTKQFLGITSGDIVEIEGSKKTSAVVWPARTEDENQAIVRMDNLIRHNAGETRSTARHRPWKVVLYVAFESRTQAHHFERYLKSGSGHAFANRHFWRWNRGDDSADH